MNDNPTLPTPHRGPRIALEVDAHGTFLRIGRLEAYARRDCTRGPSWGLFREPGAVDVEAGRFRLTVSLTPKAGVLNTLTLREAAAAGAGVPVLAHTANRDAA